MKLNFLKREKSYNKKGSRLNPDLYWNYILYFSFALIVLSFAFGFYLYKEVNINGVGPDLVVKDRELRKERIMGVLEFFKEREKKSSEILSTSSPITDPSR